MTLIIDGQIANIDETHYADFHGHSVFTTLRSKSGCLCLWPLHWQRLSAHANFFDYAVPKESALLNVIHEQLDQDDKKIRVILNKTRYAISIEPYQAPPSHIYAGVTTMISSWQTHPQLGKFKTGNYLAYALALKEAQSHGAFEALLTNVDGFVVDGSRTSLIHFDGEMMTSLLGGLDGCMRAHVLTYLRERGLVAAQNYLRPNDLASGQLLLANSLMGVVPVGTIRFDLVHDVVEQFRMDR